MLCRCEMGWVPLYWDSRMGRCIFFGSNPISWSTMKKKKKNYYLFIGNFSCYLKSSLSPKPFFILMNCLLLNLLLLILFSFSHKAYWDLLSFCSRPGLQELPWHSLCSLLQSYNKHFHQRFPYFHYAVDFDLGGCGLHKSQRELRCSASNCIIWFNLIFLIWKKILIKSRSF